MATEIKAKLQEELGIQNVMQVPNLEKIVINMGVGRAAGFPGDSGGYGNHFGGDPPYLAISLFDYGEDGRTPIPSDRVAEIRDEISARLGIKKRDISDEEIVERCMLPVWNTRP